MARVLLKVSSGYQLDDLVREVRAKGGRPVQLLPPSYAIAELEHEVALSAGEPFAPAAIDGLDAQARTAVLVHRRAIAPEAQAPAPALSWDAPGKESPRHPLVDAPARRFGIAADRGRASDGDARPLDRPRYAPMGAPIAASTGTPTSRYLIGRVAVALVIVGRERGADANPNPEHLTTAERDTAAVEAAEGLGWLAGVEPRALVEFVFERHDIELAVAPDAATPDTYEDREAPWRDPALGQLGYAAGHDGYSRLARDVRDRNHAQWGYVLFITRYPLHHFAYASAERVVQHYDNDGWGTSELNRVIAHETSHIFGALDEYQASGCDCTTKSGELQVANGNCRSCAATFVPCLMEANTLAMCDYTKGQLGWRAPLLRWNFALQIGTALPEIQDNFEFFFVNWDGDAIPDLMAVKKSQTASGKTEVHIFSGASGFKQPLLQTASALHETDASFQFAVTDWNGDGRPDLVAIKKSGTGTKHTEVHILSASSKYQRFLVQTATALAETDDTFQFSMARWGGSGRPDLVAIKKRETGTGTTEVHIFSGNSNFSVPILQTGTALHETDGTFDVFVSRFALTGRPALFAIKKRATGTKSTEIHVLSGDSQFQQFVEQSGSALHETDDSFAFAPVQWDARNGVMELAAIKKRGTGTHATEVHILRQ